VFRGYSALLKQIQATYSRQSEESGIVLTEYSILRDVTEAEVLVLDDLGAEQRQSEWTLGMLYYVINERYNERRTTIITTNLPWDAPLNAPLPERMTPAQKTMKAETLRDRISERTHSRITEMCPLRLELVADDYRKIRGARDKESLISDTGA
jgi:DNA replication protein DnaC